MQKEEILKKLEKVFQEILGIEKFSEEITMENTSEWDSLKHLQLLVAVETAFNIEIEFQKSLKMTSVAGMVNVIQSYLN